ncbi:MAG: ribbon-helix-helix domain-containing protein [Phyllobacterium sp.]|uniref:ribbon-helix-helix domain-containing protein n=1 Tax=Phyllobacterium sp. TaxID=1871046 RepID=UPI0030EFDA9D
MSAVRKRSVSIHGHRTSFSLEDAFYDLLLDIAKARVLTLAGLIAEVDEARDRNSNLSSALRLYVLDWVRNGNNNRS